MWVFDKEEWGAGSSSNRKCSRKWKPRSRGANKMQMNGNENATVGGKTSSMKAQARRRELRYYM